MKMEPVVTVQPELGSNQYAVVRIDFGRSACGARFYCRVRSEPTPTLLGDPIMYAFIRIPIGLNLHLNRRANGGVIALRFK
jgi:hypothetical protein